jgi:hypothetical protein
MTTPPGDVSSVPDPDRGRWAPAQPSPASVEQVSLDKAQPPFDPYRYGAPEHPVPPEYAPPGYAPPPVTAPPPYPAGQPGPGYAGPPYGAPYGGPQLPYATPPMYHQYPQPHARDGKAIAALVLGILSIVFFWTTLLDLLLIVPAVVFIALAMSNSKRGGGNRGMAVGGLVCVIIGCLAAATFTVFVVKRINSCSDRYRSGTSQYDHCIRHGS